MNPVKTSVQSVPTRAGENSTGSAAERAPAPPETRGGPTRRLFETQAEAADTAGRRSTATVRRQWSRFAGCLLLAALSAHAAVTVSTNAPPSRPAAFVRPELSSFRLIADRNIFSINGSRTPRGDRVDYFTLNGTMSFDQGEPLAVFSGSSSDYERVLSPGTLIAGFTVLSVSDDKVVLDVHGTPQELPVYFQMRRVDDGPWEAQPATETTASVNRPRAVRTATPVGATSPWQFQNPRPGVNPGRQSPQRGRFGAGTPGVRGSGGPGGGFGANVSGSDFNFNPGASPATWAGASDFIAAAQQLMQEGQSQLTLTNQLDNQP